MDRPMLVWNERNLCYVQHGTEVDAFNVPSGTRLADFVATINKEIMFASDPQDIAVWCETTDYLETRYNRFLPPGSRIATVECNQPFLLFLPRYCPIVIVIPNGSSMQVIVDCSAPVGSLAEQICRQLGVPTTYEYVLCAMDGKWLSAATSLHEQQAIVNHPETLCWRRKYFFDPLSQGNLEANFTNLWQYLTSHQLLVLRSEAARLAALGLHAQHGDIDLAFYAAEETKKALKNIFRSGLFESSVAAKHDTAESLQDVTEREWKRLTGISECAAMEAFVAEICLVKHFGKCSFFVTTPEVALLHVSPTGVDLVESETLTSIAIHLVQPAMGHYGCVGLKICSGFVTKLIQLRETRTGDVARIGETITNAVQRRKACSMNEEAELATDSDIPFRACWFYQRY